MLPKVEVNRIQLILDRAIEWIRGQAHLLSEDLKNALIIRLEFRKAITEAVSLEDETLDQGKTVIWRTCSSHLPGLSQTAHLGTPVAVAFSAKIQRRLASSVPPRPVVDISFNDAMVFLESLCHHAEAAYRVLKCTSASQAIVCFPFIFRGHLLTAL